MILVSHLAIKQGDFTLPDVSFEVAHGHYAVLMGKTGSGKTSLLEAICGLRPIAAGKIVLDNQDMTLWPTAARGIGYVPQDGVLFQTMTVRDQLGFALRIRGTAHGEITRRVEELSELLEIHHLLNRYPKGLSGGEAQRVALGRALSFGPRILLLDEPLSALDEETRRHMYQVLMRVKQHANVTALHVTHSLSEANALADVVLWLADGQIRAEPSAASRGDHSMNIEVHYTTQLRAALGQAQQRVSRPRRSDLSPAAATTRRGSAGRIRQVRRRRPGATAAEHYPVRRRPTGRESGTPTYCTTASRSPSCRPSVAADDRRPGGGAVAWAPRQAATSRRTEAVQQDLILALVH